MRTHKSGEDPRSGAGEEVEPVPEAAGWRGRVLNVFVAQRGPESAEAKRTEGVLRVHAGSWATKGSSRCWQQHGKGHKGSGRGWMWVGRLKAAARWCQAGPVGSWSSRKAQCGEPRSHGNRGAAAIPTGSEGMWLDPLSRKQWPCGSPVRLPAPTQPSRGAPLPIELRRGLSRQHCPDS